jgi:glutathione S-transferase
VLQIGADVYIDSQRIARELESRIPEPTLFPGAGAGLDYGMVKWADAFFRAGLHMAIGITSPTWPAEFRTDRQKLFPDIDFDSVDVAHAQSQLRAHASLIELQLRDGRTFLGGDKPGLLDIHAWTVPWFARPWMPVVNELFAPFPKMAEWEARVAALGEGERQPITCEEAFAVARAATPLPGAVEPGDAQNLRAGELVEIGPEEEMRRGDVRGAVVSASANEIAVRRSDPRCGEVVVHFPRLGYRVRRA